LFSRVYFLLGLIQRPPSSSEMTTKTTAAHEKAVLFVEIPMVKKVIPRMRNTVDALRLFGFIDCSFSFR